MHKNRKSIDQQQKAQTLNSVEIAEMIKKTVAPNLNVNSLSQQIRQYVRRKIRDRDEQWFNTMIELGHLTDTDLIDEVNEKLPEPDMKYEVLKGSFLQRYFGEKQRGKWHKISYLKYLWLKITGYEVKKTK